MAESFRRSVYRGLLCLHPPAFQQAFSREMLWIFDEVTAKEAKLPSFADAVGSLAPQWLLCGAWGKLLAREMARAAGPFALERIGVWEGPFRVSRLLQRSAVALVFLAVFSFLAFLPARIWPGERVAGRVQEGFAFNGVASSNEWAQPGVNVRAEAGASQAANAGMSSQAEMQGTVAGAAGKDASGEAPGESAGRQAPGVPIATQGEAPSTPAAKQFTAWLDQFNSGDRLKFQAFLEKNYPEQAKELDGLMRFRGMTGGFEFKKAEKQEGNRFSGILKERDSDQFARFEIEVEAAEPHRITKLDLGAIPAPVEFALPRVSEELAIAALRTEIERQVHADHFAGAVIVARNGQTIFSGAYGLADREKETKNELNTQFRIGSMNKMFTAVCVLQLVQGGKIKLTAPLGEYLPDYPNKDVRTKVTIHQLLTHTGGTGDFFGPEFDAHRLELRTLEDYVKLYGKRGLKFEPGSKWEYSNYGFLLLGVIVEKVSGQGYYDYVREHVYKPAGMSSTDSLPEDQAVPRRSVGYTKGRGSETSWEANTDTLPYRGTSAGGGYSTAGDLERFAEALANHKLLDAHYTEMLTTGKVDTGGGGKYAYGFMDQSSGGGVRSFGHGGGAPGMNGELTIYPASGYVVAVLANVDPPAAGRIASFIGNRLPEK